MLEGLVVVTFLEKAHGCPRVRMMTAARTKPNPAYSQS
jgi:hypothetical protein